VNTARQQARSGIVRWGVAAALVAVPRPHPATRPSRRLAPGSRSPPRRRAGWRRHWENPYCRPGRPGPPARLGRWVAGPRCRPRRARRHHSLPRTRPHPRRRRRPSPRTGRPAQRPRPPGRHPRCPRPAHQPHHRSPRCLRRPARTTGTSGSWPPPTPRRPRIALPVCKNSQGRFQSVPDLTHPTRQASEVRNRSHLAQQAGRETRRAAAATRAARRDTRAASRRQRLECITASQDAHAAGLLALAETAADERAVAALRARTLTRLTDLQKDHDRLTARTRCPHRTRPRRPAQPGESRTPGLPAPAGRHPGRRSAPADRPAPGRLDIQGVYGKDKNQLTLRAAITRATSGALAALITDSHPGAHGRPPVSHSPSLPFCQANGRDHGNEPAGRGRPCL
jgi:hypothetical protein